ncbi:MAG: hypothetical protein MUC62_08040 [Candidatus Thermoplasmatota archaeon]|jgi:hypothetical protein|nr:hypothetical protein [Candidatus Thermoplasmatota archaeon]
MRPWPFAILVITLIGALALFPSGSDGNGPSQGYDLRVMDLYSDTVEAYYVERDYDGLPQLDITMLRTYEDRSTYHAILMVDEDVSIDPGFLYSMSFWDVNVVVDSGTVQVWKGMDPSNTISGVKVEWAGKELHVTLSRSTLDLGKEPPNASAQFYRLDPLGEKRLETVYDEVKWTGAIPLNPYEMDIDDPEGDVVQSIVEAKRITAPSLDIIDVRFSYDEGRIECEMELGSTPISDPGARYRVAAGDLDMQWSDGALSIHGKGAGKVLTSGSVITGSRLVITATLSEPLETPFSLYTETLEWTEGGGWKGDSAPEHESLFTALLPFEMGSEVSFFVSIPAKGEVEVSISFRGFDEEQETMVRARADADGDGSVSDSEAEGVFRSALDCLEGGYWMQVPVVDGMDTPIAAVVMVSGLEGSTGRSDDIEVEYRLTIETGSSLHEGWRIAFPSWWHRPSMEDLPEDPRTSSLEISVPEGYYIRPRTLEPALLGNHLTPDGRGILLEGTGPGTLSLASGGFSFELGMDGSNDDDGTDDDGDDGPWLLYMLASGAIIVFIVALLAWWRHSRADDP